MAGIVAPAFNGVLNSNEIYNALFNLRILFQKIAPQTVDKDEVVALIEKATGYYGDSGVVEGMDIQGSYDFTMDSEAPKLLDINRNKTHKIERFVIDKWRQTDVTNDAYISKRAFLDEGTFALFNGYIVGTLAKAMDAFENGFVKSALGTFSAIPASMNLSITLPAIDGTEATERMRAALIKKAILDLKADLKDNSRKYNGYGFYASYSWDDFTSVWSSNYINEINALSLFSAFNPKYIDEKTDGHIWTPKWFGNVLTTAGTTPSTNTDIYSMVEINSDESTNFPLTDTQLSGGVYRIFPGDLLPDSFSYGANEAYQMDDKVICKIFAPEYVYYMTGFQQGEAFYNPRSATTNHYLRKGFSDVQISKFRPYITISEA